MNTTTCPTNTRKALILKDEDKIDRLDSRPTIRIKASAIKPGMVIACETLGTAIAAIDSKVPATRNSGCVAFLVENFEGRKGYSTEEIHRNVTVPVWSA